MKLAAKISLVSIVAVIAILAVSNYYAAHLALLQIKQNHQQYAEKVANSMKQPMVDAWNDGGLEAIRAQLNQPQNQQVARWVWFEKTITETAKPHATADFSEVITKKRAMSYEVATPDGSHVLYTYCPIDLGGPDAGGLEFAKQLEDYDQQTRRDLFQFLVAVGCISIASIAIVWFAGVRLIGKPLEQLTELTNRIGEGDFSGRLELKGNDELSRLASSINQMSERLENQKVSLENETLDKINVMQQLRHADRLKTVGRMAANMAHEIGTPLSVVAGRASLIAKGQLDNEKVIQNAKSIQTEAERITVMIRQALDYARQTPTEKSAVDLNEVIIQSTSLLTQLAGRQNVRIKTSLADQKAMSWVDPAQIHQVLTNLIMNAIQSMRDGGTLEVHVKLRPSMKRNATEEDYWQISVSDQGCGIPPEDLESIFEPFFTTKETGQGTGLGLSIAYRIVQEQGGWIDVASEPGVGSSFHVFLPAKAQP